MNSIFVLLLIAISNQVGVSYGKLNRLTILAFIPFTGSEPADGKICQAAMQVAVNAVNAEEVPVLQGYTIEVDYRDEGALGTKAPANLMSFLTKYRTGKKREEDIYMAPVVVGTYYICQAISGIVREFQMVQFATWCAGTIFTGNRVKFPNLYRRVAPQENQFAPQLFLAKSVARWKRVGIVYYPGNISEFLAAKFLYDLLEKAGITISWFAGVIDYSGLIESLKESQTRVVYLGFYENTRVLDFLCLAFREGIRGPRFVFIAFANSYSDPETTLKLPDDCTMEMIVMQMKAVYWVGNTEAIYWPSVNKNSSFGYDVNEFTRRLNLLTNSSRGSADYGSRLNCHDAMLHALVSLDAAEKRLTRSDSNLTLKDFSQYPEIVMKAVNQSAAYVSYEGLQHRLMYSGDRLETDQRLQSISQWQAEDRKLHLFYRMWYQSNESTGITNLSMYAIQLNEAFKWPTKANTPTNDLSSIEHQFTKNSLSVISSFGAAAGLLFLTEVAVFTIDCIKSRIFGKNGISDSFSMRFFLLLGLICLNISTMSFVEPLSVHICLVQVTCTAIGTALIGTTICAQLIRLVIFSKIPIQTKFMTKKQFLDAIAHWDKQTPVKDHLRIAIIVFTLCVAVLLGAWLGPSNSIKVDVNISPILFDSLRDTYYDISYEECTGKGYFYWSTSLIAINSLPLIAGCLLTYDLRHAVKRSSIYFVKEANALRVASVNAATFYLLVIITSVIFGSNSLARSLCWAIFNLLFSASSFALSMASRYLVVKNVCQPTPSVLNNNRISYFMTTQRPCPSTCFNNFQTSTNSTQTNRNGISLLHTVNIPTIKESTC